MGSRTTRKPTGISSGEFALKRRELLKLGLAGIVLSGLESACENKNTADTPDEPETVYEWTDGRTSYDDFDGNGCLQAYNNQNLAEAGKISSRIWDAAYSESEVIPDPAAAGLLTVVNEQRQRVEYRLQEGSLRDIKYVFDAGGRLLQAIPHVPGRPYHGSERLLCVGAREGRYDVRNGSLVVEKGKVYGSAELKPIRARGWVLRMKSSVPDSFYCILTSKRGLEFADYRTFSADVMVPSNSTGQHFFASLTYHTTIPEQPPGLSWVADLGIRKSEITGVNLFAVCVNRNTGYRVNFDLGKADLDAWYNLRMDVVTRRDDPALGPSEFRVEFYVNGELKAWERPEDCELLLDPERTGAGPDRWLRLGLETPEGEALALFDNVRAVYFNRVK